MVRPFALPLRLVVARPVDGEFAEQLAGCDADDADVEVLDQELARGSGMGSSDADVVDGSGRGEFGGWLAVQNHLYSGYALYGGIAAVLELLLSLGLGVWLLCRQERSAWLAFLAAVAIAVMLVILAVDIQPINRTVSAATRGDGLVQYVIDVYTSTRWGRVWT